ncbi:MAG: hypothetical protein ACSHX9_15515 [Luteolibacter sp.]
METSISPTISVLSATGILVALAICVIGMKSLGRKRIGLIGLSIAILIPSAFVLAALNPFLFDARFRAYQSLYRDIEIGMTRIEVIQLVDTHYPKEGRRMTPIVVDDTPTYLGFFMNPEGTREPNCEGIFLDLRDGKVISKSYSND